MFRLLIWLLLPIVAESLTATFSMHNKNESSFVNVEDFADKYLTPESMKREHDNEMGEVILRMTNKVKKLDKELTVAKKNLKIVVMIYELRKTLQAYDEEFDLTQQKEDYYYAVMHNKLFPIASSSLLTLDEKIDLLDIVFQLYPEFKDICLRSLQVAEEIDKFLPHLEHVSHTVRQAYLLILRLNMEMHNKKVVKKIQTKLEDLVMHFSEQDYTDLYKLAEHILDVRKFTQEEKEDILGQMSEFQKTLLYD